MSTVGGVGEGVRILGPGNTAPPTSHKNDQSDRPMKELLEPSKPERYLFEWN